MAAAESRFFQDFKVLKALSRYGGFRFGFILKAQNKLDGLNYAVKIAIDDSKYEIDEVTTFARLEPAHPNLVSYKNAWKDKLTQAELNSIKHPLKCLIDDFIKHDDAISKSFIRNDYQS